MSLRNIGVHLQDYTISQPRKPSDGEIYYKMAEWIVLLGGYVCYFSTVLCSSTVIQNGFITVLSDALTTTVVMFQWDRQRRCSGIPFSCTCTGSRTNGILGIRTTAVSWRATQSWWLSLSTTGWVFLVSNNISTCVFYIEIHINELHCLTYEIYWPTLCQQIKDGAINMRNMESY